MLLFTLSSLLCGLAWSITALDVARALQRAELAAQSQAVEILQSERDDQQFVVALGRVEERVDLLPALCVHVCA